MSDRMTVCPACGGEGRVQAWVVTASDKMTSRPMLVRAHVPYKRLPGRASSQGVLVMPAVPPAPGEGRCGHSVA
jgi:hypothetical protein